MPVMDGLTATRLIRGELGLLDLPVIAFTAGVRDEQQALARASGANDVLAKPMDLEQMAELLAKWIKPRVAAECQSEFEPGRVVVADAAEGFPDIAGIDSERAAKRLGQDRAMFLGLLELFIADNADAVRRARSELACGDRESAARRMHTLRSNAGFLCALDLMDLAGELEEAIERGDTLVALEPALVELERQINELVEAGAPWC